MAEHLWGTEEHWLLSLTVAALAYSQTDKKKGHKLQLDNEDLYTYLWYMNTNISLLEGLTCVSALPYVARRPRTFEPSRKNGRLQRRVAPSSTRLKDEPLVFVQGTTGVLRCPT